MASSGLYAALFLLQYLSFNGMSLRFTEAKLVVLARYVICNLVLPNIGLKLFLEFHDNDPAWYTKHPYWYT